MNGLKYTVIAIYSFAMGAVMVNMQWSSQISESEQESEPFGNIKISNHLHFKLYKNIMVLKLFISTLHRISYICFRKTDDEPKHKLPENE